MPVPANTDAVLTAVRLGWCIAEVRGRNRPDGPPGGSAGLLPTRQGHALPLQNERTAVELRLQAQAALISLAREAGVDTKPANDSSFSEEVDGHATELAKLHASELAAASGEWEKLAELIYAFDAHIQDTLTGKSPNEIGGYQLGRGLAECYWALDLQVATSNKDSPGAWWVLLSRERAEELTGLLRLLSAYFHPYTAHAIAGTVGAWRSIATSGKWRSNAEKALYRQICIWHRLTALGEDPAALVRGRKLWTKQVTYQAIRYYWIQILIMFYGVAALVLLIKKGGTSVADGAVKAFLAVSAAFGLTTAWFSTSPIVQLANIHRLANAILITPPQSPPRLGERLLRPVLAILPTGAKVNRGRR